MLVVTKHKNLNKKCRTIKVSLHSHIPLMDDWISGFRQHLGGTIHLSRSFVFLTLLLPMGGKVLITQRKNEKGVFIIKWIIWIRWAI